MELLMFWSEKPVAASEIRQLLKELCSNLEVAEAEINLKFRYFLPLPAPVSRITGYLDYCCEFKGILKQPKNEYIFHMGSEIPVLSLCPCSKEISDFGAHNQRAIIRALVKPDYPGKIIWLEELIEDVLRDSVLALRSDARIRWFQVEVESYESIHNHSAFASHVETVK
jgi:GTP cyclohydrolase I